MDKRIHKMKVLLIVIIALGFSAGLIWLAKFEPGFVLLQYGSWSLETSLVLFVGLFLLLVVVGYWVLRSFFWIKKTPKKLSNWKSAVRIQNANDGLNRGLIALEEGRWEQSERILIRHATYSKVPLLHYFLAARAAQKQGATDRRDRYLDLAKRANSHAEIAIELERVELQLGANQKQEALTTLQQLNVLAPKHPYVLQLLQEGYIDTNQWREVQAVLPDLRKRNVLPSSEVKALSVDAVKGQMEAALLEQNWADLHAVWQTLSGTLRHTDELLSIYVAGLIHQKQLDEARSLIENFMNRSFSDDLVYQYGLIIREDSLSQLSKVETWLKDHPGNASLLLTAGRLAAANRLWVKAEEYFRASIEITPSGETYLMLAEVLEAEEKHDLVAAVYRDGLKLMLSHDIFE
jgi:HemY protein